MARRNDRSISRVGTLPGNWNYRRGQEEGKVFLCSRTNSLQIDVHLVSHARVILRSAGLSPDSALEPDSNGNHTAVEDQQQIQKDRIGHYLHSISWLVKFCNLKEML